MTGTAIVFIGLLLGLCLALMQERRALRWQNAQMETRMMELLKQNKALVESLDNQLTGQ